MADDRIQFIIDNMQENLGVEVKNWLGGVRSNNDKATLAKEIIALANHGGGNIFIGFEDEGDGHPEIIPQEGELESFTQDSIANIVERYVTPTCQCTIGFYRRAGSQILHPVITVPGEHRTPVWAKRSSPDGRALQTDKVYVRRPGGSSEQARTQDDWEKMLDRLVKARQTDQLNAIREIMNPSKSLAVPRPDLDEWDDESRTVWLGKINELPPDDARRLESGHWTFSYSIEPFDQPTLRELNQALEREMPKCSGWPPFTYIHRDPLRPTAQGDIVQAWLAQCHDLGTIVHDDDHCDFWRVSRNGRGYLLRPMQEDRPSYLSNRTPRPAGPFFDWTLPIYRAAELLKFVEAMAHKFSDTNAEFNILLRYYEANGRTLQQHDHRYNLWDGARCSQSQLETRLSGAVAEIGVGVEERVFALLSPIYEQFEFTELPKVLVDNVVHEAISYSSG